MQSFSKNCIKYVKNGSKNLFLRCFLIISEKGWLCYSLRIKKNSITAPSLFSVDR